MIDTEDPIPQGANEVYRIMVTNQGSSVDRDIQIEALMPDGMEFVSGAGPTNAQADGQWVRFEPLPSLEPGASVMYTVTTKANTPGDVRFGVRLTSQHLTEPVEETEATRIFDGEMGGTTAGGAQGEVTPENNQRAPQSNRPRNNRTAPSRRAPRR